MLHDRLSSKKEKKDVVCRADTEDPNDESETDIGCSSKEMTLLREFCRDGKLKEVRRLIASCPDSVFEVDKDGITALWNAVMHGHTLIVEALLEAAGKDFQKNLVFQRASESFSCLEFALIQKNMDIARLLVKAGGEELVHRHSHEGTCLHKACRFGDISIVREILRIGGKRGRGRRTGPGGTCGRRGCSGLPGPPGGWAQPSLCYLYRIHIWYT